MLNTPCEWKQNGETQASSSCYRADFLSARLWGRLSPTQDHFIRCRSEHDDMLQSGKLVILSGGGYAERAGTRHEFGGDM